MPPSKTEIVTIRLNNNDNKFYTHSSKVIFAGYRKVAGELEEKEKTGSLNLNNFKIGTVLKVKTVESLEHTAPPPPRYNQATLIGALEKAGVGRPSTYRLMASVAADRGYADIQSRAFTMTTLGDEVIKNISKYFPEIIDLNLTKEMEEHLDLISHGSET
jgi:DNA topoisomerase-1